jgi:hypothetical protein
MDESERAVRRALWRRPSLCGSSGCVEVAELDGEVGVRDGKDPRSPVLRYDRAEFSAFVRAAKAGEYDDLCEG